MIHGGNVSFGRVFLLKITELQLLAINGACHQHGA
jgi:hypothetical protein